jgi:hypothetical protein
MTGSNVCAFDPTNISRIPSNRLIFIRIVYLLILMDSDMYADEIIKGIATPPEIPEKLQSLDYHTPMLSNPSEPRTEIMKYIFQRIMASTS